MWQLQVTEECQTRIKRFSKRRDREVIAVMDNLDTYHKALDEGAKPLQVKFGFMHFEPMGIVAIDQKGGGRSLQETRLYVYADIITSIIHVILLGDKNQQGDDINFCRRFIQNLRKSTEDDHQHHIQKRARIDSEHLGLDRPSEDVGKQDCAPKVGQKTAGDTSS